MSEEEKWECMMFSMRKAAHILGISLTEQDVPDYLNWKLGSRRHKKLWSQVYALRRKR